MKSEGNRKYRQLAKDTGLFTISSFGSKILVFLLTPLYTSLLTTAEYGIADMIATTVHFIYPILTLAIADAALRFALDAKEDKRSVFSISTLFVLLSVVVLLALKPLVAGADPLLQTYWYIFVLYYALFNIHNYFSNFVKALGKTTLFAVQGLLHTAAIIVGNLLCLLVFRLGLKGYLASMLLGYLIPIGVMFFGAGLYRYILPFRIERSLLRNMLRYSIPMIPTILAWAANNSIDKYMIIGMVGLEASGIYNVAHKIPTMITTVLTVFTQAWQLSVISNHGSEDESAYHTKVYGGLDLVTMGGCMAVILLCRPISRLLFAADFAAAWQCVPMLVLAAMFSSHSGFLAAAYRAAKNTKSLFVSVAAGALLNVLLNYFLIGWLGMVGAAIGTAVSMLAVWIVRMVLVQKIVKIDIPVVKTAVCYGLMFLSAALVTFSVPGAIPAAAAASVIILLLHRKTAASMLRGLTGFLRRRRKTDRA